MYEDPNSFRSRAPSETGCRKRTRRCYERKPTDSLRDKSNVIFRCFPSLTLAFTMKLMKLTVPQIELARGMTICLHIPHGCEDVDEVVENELLQLAGRQGKKVALSRPAEISWGDEISPRESCVGWLSRVTGISQEESKEIVAGLGVRVADALANNAGTPRALLGIAAALAQEPEVLIYSAKALDAEGCWRVHQFVRSECRHLCVIHVSYPHVLGDGSPHPRDCPQGARCFALNTGS